MESSNQELTINELSIDIAEIVKLFKDNLIKIISSTFIISILSIYISLQITPIYTSEAVLFPSDKKNNSSSFLQSFSQLSGLIGGGSSAVDNVNSLLAIESIKTRSFLESFIKKRELLIPLVAAIEWSQDSEEFLINPAIYDRKTNVWKNFPNGSDKTLLYYEAYENLQGSIEISEDRRTGVIKLSLRHYSPYIAKKWLEWIIEDINMEFKVRDASDAELAIDELTRALNETNSPNLDLTYSALIEQRLNKLTLANTKTNYVFEVVDPPYLAMQRTSPRRTLIVIVSTLFAGLIFSLFFITMSLFKKNRIQLLSLS